jgi:hypothetical protein
MLRIRFGREDLARLRFMISPMAETVLSVALLHRGDAGLPVAGWRQAQRQRLVGAPSRALLELIPAGWQPRVALAPIVGERPRFDEELDAILEFSPRPLRAHLATLDAPSLVVRWLPLLGDDARSERRLLGRLLADYHGRCVADDWPALRVHLEADVAARQRLRAERGAAAVLAGLDPAARWNDPVLEVDVPGPARCVELAGRGLVLVPSASCWPDPIVLLDGTGQPVLLYPAAGVLGLRSTPGYDRDVLAALLGSTRAALLVAAAGGETTSGLAQRLGVSVAATSQQLAVLRHGGLVASTRRGRAVHHDLTPLGVRLLLASGPFSPG